ncbi:hypothetical protein ABTK02_22580, partial [Acinetobacter baumannii]
LYFYSLMGVIAARLVMSLIVFVMSMWSARHMIGTTLSSALMNLWQVAAASLAMATLVLLLRHQVDGRILNDIVQLALT